MAVNRKQCRHHSAELKARVLAACAQPGVSVAAVALSFGLTDNLVHQWRRGRGVHGGPAVPQPCEPSPEFVALSLPAPLATPIALICDDYKAYETLFKIGQRIEAGCVVHSRRKFDKLIKHGHSEVAAEAIRRMAWIFMLEKEARGDELLPSLEAHWPLTLEPV